MTIGLGSHEWGSQLVKPVIRIVVGALVEPALKQRPHALIHGYAHVLHDQAKPGESLELLSNWVNEHLSADGGAMYGHVQWQHIGEALPVGAWQSTAV